MPRSVIFIEIAQEKYFTECFTRKFEHLTR